MYVADLLLYQMTFLCLYNHVKDDIVTTLTHFPNEGNYSMQLILNHLCSFPFVPLIWQNIVWCLIKTEVKNIVTVVYAK